MVPSELTMAVQFVVLALTVAEREGADEAKSLDTHIYHACPE
jgi:hypothetical protein